MRSAANSHSPTQHAFSLVELSIVLVILGLLAGGILAGKSLIRASELRAVTAEYQRYVAATHAFREKYFMIPGDVSNATSFWGTATACPGDNTTPSTTQATCDGDGGGTLSASAATSNELYRFWQHLANAGLVEGKFTGVSNGTSTQSYSLINTNVPASRLSNSGWTAYYYPQWPISDANNFDGYYGVFFFFGGSSGTSVTGTTVLMPEEAWNIDTKLDDGLPALGRIMTREIQGGTCSDLAASTSASLRASVYLLSSTSISCSLMMKTGL